MCSTTTVFRPLRDFRDIKDADTSSVVREPKCSIFLLFNYYRDASIPLTKAEFLAWVENGLKIVLSGDVTLEDTAKALGVLSQEASSTKE